ncbi:MAG: hypothetical protein M1837_001076 [Sclerophora amabilis]|nr:MAG: hypothetical protein M1837_001076 [Sclerophora amabilis]
MKPLTLVGIPPYEGFSSDDFLGGGGCGFVDFVDDSIALKYMPKHDVDSEPDDPNRELEILREERRREECARYMRREKRMFLALDVEPHPHILQSLLHVPDGIFMPRLQCTLEHRLEPEQGTICKKSEMQWIRGIASGAAWLEEKGIVHGDVRPPNVLLDRNEDVKLCDFDCSVRLGDTLMANTARYTRTQAETASAQSELFSIGSTIHNIVTKRVVYDEIDDEEEIQRRFHSGEFPPTEDSSLTAIVQRCWTHSYDNVAQLAEETRQIYDQTTCGEDGHAHLEATVLGRDELSILKNRCESYAADPSLLKVLKKQQSEERKAIREQARLVPRQKLEVS